MKPCLDPEKINQLIERRKRLIEACEAAIDYHNSRIDMLQTYKYELRKPGFRTPGLIRVTPGQGGNTLIAPHNTWDGH